MIDLRFGDSNKLIKEIPDNSIDLIIIDPPYEFMAKTGKGCFGDRPYINQIFEVAENKSYRQLKDKIKSKNELSKISYGFNYELLDELDRTMKKINIYIWCNKKQVRKLLQHYEEKDCNIDILTWHKDNILPIANNHYLNDTEYCIFARDKGVKLHGDYYTKRKYYVTHTNAKDKKLYGHPTIKPLDIIKNYVFNSSEEGDIVLDCFMGSGTTGVACKELNRNFIGIEIDKNYFEIAQNRINELDDEKYEQISF